MKERETLSLHAKDPSRAKQFYNDLFETSHIGVHIQEIERKEPKPKDQVAVDIIDVPDIDFLLKKVTSNGGSISVPKIHIPSVGYLAYFTDTEGNIIGVVEKDHH